MTIQEGREKAREHVATIFPEFQSESVRLEEVETPAAAPRWSYTFSVVLPLAEKAALQDLFTSRRITKAVEIDPINGDLIAIRNSAA